MTGDFAFLLRT